MSERISQSKTSRFLMRTRADFENLEERHLAPGATRSTQSKGRAVREEPDDHRTVFERDRDRVVHSKAFRRLKHKTQVFINPEGDHFVTRLTHTVNVTQIGRSISRYLGLNEALTEAICLGHDVGHSPFGHTGEDALSDYFEDGWLHATQGVRVFEVLEPLNLTWEVLDGIRAHSWRIPEGPATPEGMVCRFADRIAYLAHDAEDAIRAGILSYSDLPRRALDRFGRPGREWIASMIFAVTDESHRHGEVTMEPEALAAMLELREFMFERVYLRPESRDQRGRAMQVVRDLVDHFSARLDEIPESYRHDDADPLTQVVDYVAGMTDRYALRLHAQLIDRSLTS